jgi:hypothetical protein
VIHLVRNRLARNAVDRPLYLEFMFTPPVFMKRSSKALCAFRFPSARADDLLDWYRCAEQNGLKLLGDFWEIDAKDRLSMGVKLDLKACGAKRIKHGLTVGAGEESVTFCRNRI